MRADMSSKVQNELPDLLIPHLERHWPPLVRFSDGGGLLSHLPVCWIECFGHARLAR